MGEMKQDRERAEKDLTGEEKEETVRELDEKLVGLDADLHEFS
jgi:hypothetical protein